MHANAAVRLIALDLDGTLLGGDQAISPQNAQALRRAAGQGIALAVCSGRAPFEIQRFLQPVKELRWHIISLNGALLRTEGHPDRIAGLTRAQFLRCWDLCRQSGAQCFFYTEDTLYTNRGDHEERPQYTRRVGDEDVEGLAEHVIKFVAHCEDAQALKALRNQLEPEGLSIQSSWHTNFEVNAPGVDKGYGLATLADHLGIDLAHVMAMGDQENDLPMLRIAGVPVAMGNAIPAVKDLAVHITASNREDGVAQALEALLGWTP